MLGELDRYMQKKNECRSPAYTINQNNSKWVKDLNISHDILKILAENIVSNIFDISFSNIFANISPRTREIEEKINT